MASLQIPKFNQSLKAFTRFVDTSTIAGAIATIVGLAVSFANLFVGAVILYIGILALALGIIARFLRQTALIIVEGLGGTIEIDYSAPTTVFSIDQFRENAKEGWSEDELSGLLPKNLYDAWIKQNKPSLKKFAASNEDSFYDWLLSQKSK